MILFDNDFNPAMRYEGLARFAFDNCDKYGDPWGYCAQEKYSNFVPEPNEAGKRALSTILIKLIINNPENDYTDSLKELEQKVWDSKSQTEIIDIIDESIALFQ